MSMDYFFEGLEHSSAFGFLLDEQGKFVPVKETCYQLYESDYYPFEEFVDELRALNDNQKAIDMRRYGKCRAACILSKNLLLI